MRRISIVGGPGAGKTTLALELGRRLVLPIHHMDRMFWLPGWQPASSEARSVAIAEVLGGAAYILEGLTSLHIPHGWPIATR
jgi:adenylate kinase family enzyme